MKPYTPDDLVFLLLSDSAGAGGDPGRPVCRQPPSAAGAPQPLLTLPHPGTQHTHNLILMQTHLCTFMLKEQKGKTMTMFSCFYVIL